MPSLPRICDLLHQLLGRPHPHRRPVADVLDAVGAAGRAAAARHDEGERPLEQRHPVLVERQQVVQRDRQVVQVGDERPVGIDDDLLAPAPDEPAHVAEVGLPVRERRQLARPVRRVVLAEERVDEGRPVELAPLEVVDQIAHRQVRLAAQAEVEGGERPQRLHRHRRDVRAEGHGRRADRLRQERPVHVLLQRRAGELGHVVPGALGAEDGLERLPAHALGDRVDDLHRVGRLQQRRHLRQRHLRPDHVLARSPADAVLGPDPDGAVGRRRVHEQHVELAGLSPRDGALARDAVGVRVLGRQDDQARLPADVLQLRHVCRGTVTHATPPLSLHPRSTRAGPT